MTTSRSIGRPKADKGGRSRRAPYRSSRNIVLAALVAVALLTSGIFLFAQHTSTGTASLGVTVAPAVQLTTNGTTTVSLWIRLASGGTGYLWGDSSNSCTSPITGATTYASSGKYDSIPLSSITSSNTYVCAYDPGGTPASAFVLWPHTPASLAFGTQPTNTVSGASISPAVTVKVLDSNGLVDTASTASVTISITSGTGTSGATLSGTLTQSAVNGVATFNNLSINLDGTGYQLHAAGGTLTAADSAAFTITSASVSAGTSTVTASPTSVVADGSTTSTITVTLLDANSNPVSGKTVTLAQGSGSSTVSPASGPSSTAGVVTFTVKDTKAEAVTYTATDTTDSISVTPTATVTFTAGAVTAGNSTVTASPATVVADGSTTSTVTVTLKDVNNNPVSSKAVSLAAGSGSSTTTTLSGTTNSSGQATFTVKDTVAQAVVYTATDITDSNLTITQTATVTFTPGTLDHFKVENTGGGAIGAQTAGTAFNLRLTAQDLNNNTVTSFTSTASLTSTGTLTGTPVTSGSFVAGVLDPQSVIITNTGSFTITATGSGKTGTSAAFTVNPGALDHFLVEKSGGGAIGTQIAGTAFSLRLTAQDLNNNTVTSFTSAVSLTSTGTLTGSPVTSGNFVAGVLDPQSVTITNTGSFTITATGSGKAGTSAPFTVNPGALDHFKVEKTGGGAIGTQTAGTAFSLRLTAQDLNNNTVTSFTSTATLTSTGTLTGSPVTSGSFVAGVLDPQSVTITNTGSFTITATGSGKTGASSNFTVNAGTAAKLVFTTAPSSTGTGGTVWTQQPVVTVEDTNGNTVTSYSTSVTLAINSGTGALTCSPVTPTSGLATFAGCSLDKATTYTLKASSGTITNSTTNPSITISAGSAAKFAITGTATQTAGVSQTITITAQDAGGNTATSYTGSKSLTFSGANSSPNPATHPTVNGTNFSASTSIAFTSGASTGSLAMVLYDAETASVSVTDGLISSSGAGNLTVVVNAAAAKKLIWGVEPPPTGYTRGNLITPAMTVLIDDQYGNLTSSTASVALAFNKNGGNGTMSGTTPVNAVNGTATFNDIKITANSSNSGTFTATSSGLTSATSNTFNY